MKVKEAKPLVCACCGLRLWGDEAIWLGPSWEVRDPFCPECAADESRRLLREGV